MLLVCSLRVAVPQVRAQSIDQISEFDEGSELGPWFTSVEASAGPDVGHPLGDGELHSVGEAHDDARLLAFGVDPPRAR